MLGLRTALFASGGRAGIAYPTGPGLPKRKRAGGNHPPQDTHKHAALATNPLWERCSYCALTGLTTAQRGVGR